MYKEYIAYKGYKGCIGYKAIKQGVAARELALCFTLAAMPLSTRRPRLTPRAISRMADRMRTYSPNECRAADSRAATYDAHWGLCGDSQLAGFLDMERARINLPAMK